MKRKFISTIVSLSILCSFIPCVATAEEVASGTCGADTIWTLDDTGTLTISGSGDAYSSPSNGWDNYALQIKKVVIEEGIDEVAHDFNGYTALESITIPATLTNIIEPFKNCISLTDINVNSDNTVYSSVDGILYDKSGETLLQYPSGRTNSEYTVSDKVTSIENGAFYETQHLESVTLPKSVVELNASFVGGAVLSKIEVEEGHEHFVSNNGVLFDIDKTEIVAYPAAKSAESYHIPETVAKIGKGAFNSTKYLKSITVSEMVTSIGKSAFWNCTELNSVILPDSIEEIENFAFGECTSLTNLELPENLKKLGAQAFIGCISLEKMTIPAHTTTIGSGMFKGCSSLTEVVLPDGIMEIGDSAFEDCTALKSVNLPDTLRSIRTEAFYNCTSLKEVMIPDSITTIGGYAFYNCTSLESIDIPYGVSEIMDGTFYNCTSLKEVTIPGSVTKIWNGTFYNCISLNSITIPEGVTDIYDAAFAECTELLEIRIPNTLKGTGYNAFEKCYPDNVYYNGIENEWNALSENSDGRGVFEYATVHFEPKPIITDTPVVTANNNTYTAQVPLKNVLVDSYLIAALYDDGVLVGIESKPLTLETTSEEISIKSENADEVKVFVWNSLSGAEPMCKSYSVDTIQ